MQFPLQRFIDRHRIPSKNFVEFTVEKDTKWYVGTTNEFLDKIGILPLKSGKWKYVDYYDHAWSMCAIHKNYSLKSEVEFQRETQMDSDYGFIDEKNRQKVLSWIKEEEDEFDEKLDMDRIQELFRDSYQSENYHVTFGRGETEFYIYVAENDEGEVIAWGIFTDSVLDVIDDKNEELYQFD